MDVEEHEQKDPYCMDLCSVDSGWRRVLLEQLGTRRQCPGLLEERVPKISCLLKDQRAQLFGGGESHEDKAVDVNVGFLRNSLVSTL
mmetsp:Transcript_5839/g.8677  ORF Transcript_5839/g.8677 Transcript_5839/m.8677 type:complete len:87 (+) Transcript_5839:2356-2616(+)